MNKIFSNRQENWFTKAEQTTIKELPAFIEEILKTKPNKDYRFYPEFPQVVASIALAGANAAMKEFAKDISNEQKQAILVYFIQEWIKEYKNVPFRIIDYSWMLYPDNKDVYTTICPNVFQWLQKTASQCLKTYEIKKEKKEPVPPEEIIKHWESIVNGKVPFGLHISK